jgi:hypothetical protein
MTHRLRDKDTAPIAAGAGVPLAILLGWIVVHGYSTIVLAIIGLIVLCALAVVQRGIFIGLMLLAAMNGIPFLNTVTTTSGKVTLQEVALTALVITAIVWIAVDNQSYHPTQLGRLISYLGVVLFAWWFYTLTRTILNFDGDVLQAFKYGDDFFYYALILTVMPRVRLEDRDIRALITTATVGVCIYAVAQATTSLHITVLSAFMNAYQIHTQGHLLRVYDYMNDLVAAGLAISVAASFLVHNLTIRRLARCIALLLLISVLLMLTRALWLGMISGLLLVSLWMMYAGGPYVASVLRRKWAWIVSLLVLAGALLSLTDPSAITHGELVERASSAVSTLETSSGTLAVRESVDQTLTSYLSGHWAAGLGFVSPSMHYYSDLPHGSIRDPDVGILNALVTMGLIGTIMVYMPVILVLIACLRKPEMASRERYAWLRYGGAVWLACILISSITLVILFSPAGLALTGVMITVICRGGVVGQVQKQARACHQATAISIAA